MMFAALASGTIAAAILLFFSHVAPVFGAGEYIRDIDELRLFRKELTRREAHVLGALVHLLTSVAFAGAYAYLVSVGMFVGFDFWSILGWGVMLTIFMGGVIMPLSGHGLFGVKEDAWFPVDLVLTNIAWSILFWWIVQFWPVA